MYLYSLVLEVIIITRLRDFNFTLWSARTAKFTIRQVFFFLLLLVIIRSGRLPVIRWSVCMSKSQRSLCVSSDRTDAYTICSHGQFNFPAQFPVVSPFPLSRVWSYTLSVVVCYIRLICDSLFRLYHHITYICCFDAPDYYAVIWIVSSRPPIFTSSRPFNNPLVIAPKAPIIPCWFFISKVESERQQVSPGL